MAVKVKEFQQRQVGCKEIRDILEKGLKYDNLLERYKKLLIEYDLIKAEIETLKEYHLPSLKSIMTVIEKRG